MDGLALWDVLTLFWPALTAVTVASLVCGLLGAFVVMRRVAFVSAALGQISGLGVAGGFLAGMLLGHDPHEPTPLWLDPVMHALVLSGAVAAAFAFVSRVQRTPPESVVAFTYLFAAAATVIVLASPSILQEAHEVGDLLFGNSVAVRNEHLIELIVVALAVLISQLFLFRSFLFVSFDREMARTLGLRVRRLELLLHFSIGLTVAVATRTIGALPVFGFLVLPASAALLMSERISHIVVLSMLGAVLAAVGGFFLSFPAAWPTGPTMVLVASAYWPLAFGVRGVARLLQRPS